MELNRCSRCGNFYVAEGNVCPKCNAKDGFEFSTFKSYTPELFSQYDVDDVVYLNAERNQRYFEQISTVLEGEFKGPF